MPAKLEQDWSDSDDDDDYLGGDVETSVQLGIPDGSISSQSDLCDPCVSKIGGRPTFVMSNHPDISCSQCRNCSNPMEMIVQIWCPLEDSPMDRALYVWACPNGPCQKKDGSVRAWRGLKLNEKFAAKLAKRAAKKEQQGKTSAPPSIVSSTKPNPFSLTGPSAPNSSGLGSQIFGSAPAHDTILTEASVGAVEDDISEEETDGDIESDLVEALRLTTLDDSSQWTTAPAYPPLYLSTVSEYLPSSPNLKPVHIDDPLADGDKKNKESLSFLEAYENSLNIDEVFSRFTKRVGYEGQQCIRYELNGTPLPFASDEVFDRLFPIPKPSAVTVTRAAFVVESQTAKRTFSAASIPLCQKCQSPRVFECQLMPNLINMVRSTTRQSKVVSEEQRRKDLERELKNKSGMEWGTCMIFCCELSCCMTGKDGWVEEHVVVQWE